MSGTLVAWDAVRDNDTLPDGIYHVKIEEMVPDTHNDGRLIVRMRARVIAPTEYEGSSYFQRFFLGTQDDPDFTDPATQAKSISARQLKQLAAAAGVTLPPNLGAACASLTGVEVLLTNKQTTTDQGGVFNNVGRFFALGAKPVGLSAGTQASARPRVTNGSGTILRAPATATIGAPKPPADFALVEE
jgi:hypothetical protein